MMSYLFLDFGLPASVSIPLHCDNMAALHILKNPVFHERTKHRVRLSHCEKSVLGRSYFACSCFFFIPII